MTEIRNASSEDEGRAVPDWVKVFNGEDLVHLNSGIGQDGECLVASVCAFFAYLKQEGIVAEDATDCRAVKKVSTCNRRVSAVSLVKGEEIPLVGKHEFKVDPLNAPPGRDASEIAIMYPWNPYNRNKHDRPPHPENVIPGAHT